MCEPRIGVNQCQDFVVVVFWPLRAYGDVIVPLLLLIPEHLPSGITP
jgi:hypothetical protein